MLSLKDLITGHVLKAVYFLPQRTPVAYTYVDHVIRNLDNSDNSPANVFLPASSARRQPSPVWSRPPAQTIVQSKF